VLYKPQMIRSFLPYPLARWPRGYSDSRVMR
jgi:hypothetical protein